MKTFLPTPIRVSCLLMWIGSFASALDLPKLVREARPAVVEIVSMNEAGEKISAGTGFFITQDGTLVTNWHVVKNAAKVSAKLENGASFEIQRVGAHDVQKDLVFLYVRAKGVTHLPLGDDKAAEVGSDVAVIGNPLGLEGTVTSGIVSGKREIDGCSIIQITAAISPGSSGSPVLNSAGEVIAVASASHRRGQNLNLAVAASEVRALQAQAALEKFITPAPRVAPRNDPPATIGLPPAEIKARLTPTQFVEDYLERSSRTDTRRVVALYAAAGTLS